MLEFHSQIPSLKVLLITRIRTKKEILHSKRVGHVAKMPHFAIRQNSSFFLLLYDYLAVIFRNVTVKFSHIQQKSNYMLNFSSFFNVFFPVFFEIVPIAPDAHLFGNNFKILLLIWQEIKIGINIIHCKSH